MLLFIQPTGLISQEYKNRLLETAFKIFTQAGFAPVEKTLLCEPIDFMQKTYLYLQLKLHIFIKILPCAQKILFFNDMNILYSSNRMKTTLRITCNVNRSPAKKP